MKSALKVLILEDSEHDAAFLIRELGRGGFEVDFERVWTMPQFQAALEHGPWDIILSECRLPGFDGLTALAHLDSLDLDIPFILVSGLATEDEAVAAMNVGAKDYVMKGNPARLLAAVKRELRASQERRCRREAEIRLEEVHQQLLEASRMAGMAETATEVLHNVGNLINNVNVATSIVADRLRQSRTTNFSKAVALMRPNASDLARFLAHDPVGQKILPYLGDVIEDLEQERTELLKELEESASNLRHVMDLISVQQNCAKTCGRLEELDLADLLDQSVRLTANSLARNHVEVVRQYASVPVVLADKQAVLHVFVNLIRNAELACLESGKDRHVLNLRLAESVDWVRCSVTDDGVGIAPENVARLFHYGFTTRKNGHGFGLHSSVLAAKKMGGALSVQSEGPGKGATFTLSLPRRSGR